MTTGTRLPVLATHSGTFHLDDAFAQPVLRVAFGLRCNGPSHDRSLHLSRASRPSAATFNAFARRPSRR